jgi:LacI family transcriptional regulator
MKTTISDVAELADVSKSTVSLVLNNRANVGEDTRARVFKAIKDLDYRPLKAAQALTTKKTRNIGFMEILPVHEDTENRDGAYGVSTMIPTFAYDVARGVERETQRCGYGLLFSCWYNRLNRTKLEIPAMITNSWVDGLLLVGGAFPDEFIHALKTWCIPFVFVGGHSAAETANCVFADCASGGFQAVDYLISLGHRRIGFINGPGSTQTSFDKMQGYLSALHKHHIELDESLIESGDFSAQSGYEAMCRLLDRCPGLTAVFVGFDGMALGARQAVLERRLRIPEDISLIGFEDGWIATHFEPALTTVKVFKFELGVAAVNMLFESMSAEGRRKPKKIIIPTELIVRRSCRRLEEVK